MTIVVTGGGSGGHITPLLAVATEIKKQAPSTRIVYVGQRGDRFGDMVGEHPAIDESHVIFAGKFRRYHGEGWRQLLDLKTILLNVRDLFRVAIGTVQCITLLGRLRPKAIFTRGGFVSVPVGFGATIRKIPYITHDSDAIPSLANRLIAKHAFINAVALPKEIYPYLQSKTVTVGVPIAAEYKPVTKKVQTEYKAELGLPKDALVVTVTGGGLGAHTINVGMTEAAQGLLQSYSTLHILHFTGHAHAADTLTAYKKVLQPAELARVHVYDYSSELYKYTGAADVAVVRAGATNMAEMAEQGKACVIVPNPVLTGGHQLKNAKAYQDKRAVIVVDEQGLKQDAHLLLNAIAKLLGDVELRDRLGKSLHEFAYPDSAERLAKLLLADTDATPVK